MIIAQLMLLIITLIIFYNLIRVAVREAILEAKSEIMKDLKIVIKGAIIQAEKDSKEVHYENDTSNNHVIDRRV